MMTEQWRPVVGYEGLYEVSSLGNVRALDRVIRRNSQSWTVPAGPRKTTVNAVGYAMCNLRKDGKARTMSVHVLVAEAFLGPRPDWATQINHIDRDKTNNSAVNLEWSHPSHNVRHAFAKYFYKGKMRSCAELAELAGLNCQTLYMRLNKSGWSVEQAVSTPVRRAA
jgi:hypothetical protein